ncbi:hypothetical protein [Evansella halocellulosilytica]|nr:hypothetical protein [Evansella halocellulosilytica]
MAKNKRSKSQQKQMNDVFEKKTAKRGYGDKKLEGPNRPAE